MFTSLHTVMNMYVHSIYMYININICTYMYMNFYKCMYMVHTCLWIHIVVCILYIYIHRCSWIYVWTLYRLGPVCAGSQPHFISHQAQSALRRRRVSAPRKSSSFWAAFFLAPVFSIDRPPRRGLPHPNCHSHQFTSYALLPSLPLAAAVSQLSTTSCVCYTGEDW